VALTAGTRAPIHVDFANTAGVAFINVRWKLPGATSFVAIPNTNVFRDANSSQQGLLATYYPNTTLTTPFAYQVAENNNPALTYNFGGGSPDPTIPNSNFTARWTGQILPQYTEPYYFTVKSDDGARLWVNGQLLIDKWQTQGTTEWTSYPINLQAGVYYDIQLDYLQLTGNTEVHLSWYSSDQPKQIIPANRLFPTMTGVAQAVPAGVTSPANDTYILGSGTPYSYVITGNNGASSYSVSGLPQGLALNGNVISGTPAQAGNYQFTVTVTNAAGSTSTVVSLNVVAPAGNITRELWTGLPGTNISDIPFTTAPTSSDSALTTLEDAAAYANNTGERLRGYFTAPTTGNYYFWIAANNAAELWISDSSEVVCKVRRAYVTGPTGTAARTWNTQSTQQSPWLSLTAGQKYYFEVLHNTGSGGAGSNLSVGWFLDPTGKKLNALANGAGPASAAAGGLVPGYALAPWDNPPTTTAPGSVYVATLQASSGSSNNKATGGAYLRVNGSTAVVHLNYAGLTSSVVSRRIYLAAVGNGSPTLLFDLDNQDRNYPALKTSDAGYTWNLGPSDLTALGAGSVYLDIATVNPSSEITGTFRVSSGSQVAPSLPSYSSPSWTDDHATSLTSNSRFLTQATFGPSPADMTNVKNNGYSSWIESQFSTAATHHVPYVLANLTADPTAPYYSTLMFNSWWQKAVTAPDQLRQRIAFALSEILVVSDTGTLSNNGRALATYYDMLLDYSFDNYRNILKQATLSPAMGAYLDMQGNDVGNLTVGSHSNENYARNILQLFSLGLYRLWPDGSLMLDSNGSPIPLYDQNVIGGMARVFTGWGWGQPLSNGRLPASFSTTSDFLDPMVLVSTHHDLGTKQFLDNVVLPAATVTTQSDTAADPASNPITISSPDPVLGAGNLVSTSITSTYDLNGLRDLESALDNIFYHPNLGPYLCRQLIQRLVTSNPKPEYVYRVVRAFNGERNINNVATGVRGDMKEVIRAILLDPEARSATEAADVTFGKQREPLLRVAGPARAFPVTGIPNCSYRQSGGQYMLVTTPSAHRLTNGDTVLLDTFVDSASKTPSTGGYSVGNTTPSYSVGASGIVTVTLPNLQQLYKTGDSVRLQFLTGTLGITSPYNLPANYTVTGATATTFTFNLGSSSFTGASGNLLTTNSFTVSMGNFTTPSYTISGSNATVALAGLNAGDQIFVIFTSGSLAGGTYDKLYTVGSATAINFTIPFTGSPGSTSGNTLIQKFSGGYSVTNSDNVSAVTVQISGNHNLNVGDQVQLDILVGNSPNSSLNVPSGVYAVSAVPGANSFTVLTKFPVANGSQSTNGMVAYPLVNSSSTRSGTVTLDYGTWNIGYSDSDVSQTPLNSPTAFNFFSPSYQYPGALLSAGLTTPEFQLTNETTTVNLTNVLTAGILNAGNGFGFTSFRSGGGSIDLDLSSYMTSAQTVNSAIPTTVHAIATVLAGGNVTAATESTISSYITGNINSTISGVSATSPCTVTTSVAHGLATGATVTISGVSGGTFSPASPGINSTYTITVTGANTFTLTGLNCTSTSGLSVTNAIYTSATLTNTLMRDRVRAIVQLIVTSAEYAIQK
jgi:uncharacterized protein (DUF1800 family)